MATEDVLNRCRRQHNVAFHRVVDAVDIMLKDRTHRVEVFDSAGRFGFSIFEYWELEQEPGQFLHAARYSKPEYTSGDAALAAALNSLGYRT